MIRLSSRSWARTVPAAIIGAGIVLALHSGGHFIRRDWLLSLLWLGAAFGIARWWGRRSALGDDEEKTAEITPALALFIFLLVLGAILDIFSAIVLVVPLILPIAAQYGVNDFHLGIVFLAAMQLGYLTPPVGLNLFIASYRFERPIMNVYTATFPFLLILMVCVLIIMYWANLSLWLLPD